MPDWILPALATLALLMLALLVWRSFSRPDTTPFESAVRRELDTLGERTAHALERLERELRDEMSRQSQATRADLGGFQQALLAQGGESLRTQNEQIDSFRTQLATMQQQVSDALARHGETTALAQQRAVESQAAALQRQAETLSVQLQRFGQALGEQLKGLSDGNERRLGEVRQAVETRLATLQEGNEKKLEQMRATVDEKLHATLEQRLGESFRQVAERLDQVHKGLGEMQTLARDVGSLNRVLSNVKTRGIVGEYQLGALLEQVFTPEQYAANVETVPGTGARVEFAIRLPGRAGADGSAPAPLWLPIDAKFPRDDYDRLLDAQDRADVSGVEAAGKALEARLKLEARTIREKYVAAPHTTDFAILFVPTEGLYAEALRRPGLVEWLQREQRITLAGPTTLLATLSSLQMGFRTLALERRSAEVWQVLGAVKTEFGKFGDILAKARKKIEDAGNTLGEAEKRTLLMGRKLRQVEALPMAETQAMLPPSALGPAGTDDGASGPVEDLPDLDDSPAAAPAADGPRA